jgi:UDP-glucuronate 4-epimerase
MPILVTGAAGFIGFHLAQRLLRDGAAVVGFDAFTPYYDVALKRARWSLLEAHPGFTGIEANLEDKSAVQRLFAERRFSCVVHLAAQAGVRYSVENPASYMGANVLGTFHLLEALRAHPVAHLLLASTSSVYGGNAPPFSEADRTDHPVSLYAATKKSTEAMAHAYAHLWKQPTSVLRFFTVYGPWGRPDMALFKFTRAILGGEPIDLYNSGRMRRDFTYVDDVVESVVRLVGVIPAGGVDDPADSPVAPFRAINIASGRVVELEDYITAIEAATGRAALRNPLPMQQGDVRETHGRIDELVKLTGFTPATPIAEGVEAFVSWYRDFYQA